jgi:catechol 2,3-dioxygenase-like lactoylglutathione lyase family enzyme
MSTAIPPLEEIDHVQLPVPNTDTAVAWYTTHLGFTIDLHRADLPFSSCQPGLRFFSGAPKMPPMATSPGRGNRCPRLASAPVTSTGFIRNYRAWEFRLRFIKMRALE